MKTTQKTNQLTANLNDLETKLEEIFGKKAPAMPENVKELIVQYGPYVSVVIMVISLPALLTALGIGAVFMPFAFAGSMTAGINTLVAGLVSIVSLVMSLMALPGLFKRQMSAWKLTFWASLVTAIGAVFRMDLGGLIIGSAISWWVLFQIKSYYKN